MSYTIKYACVCNIGNKRKQNQDNYICSGSYRKNEIENTELPICGEISSDHPEIIGVFDGMGGEDCGEIASLLAAREAADFPLTKKPVQDIIELCFSANDSICEYADENGLYSMGTTAAMILFSEKEITVCNIGDSRIYQCNGKGLHQISVDHVFDMNNGRKPPLTQNLGIPEDEMLIEPFVAQIEYHDEDIFVIASDGLTDMVPEETIYNVLQNSTVDKMSQMLLEEALRCGGQDNITVIVCKVEKKKLWRWSTTKP